MDIGFFQGCVYHHPKIKKEKKAVKIEYVPMRWDAWDAHYRVIFDDGSFELKTIPSSMERWKFKKILKERYGLS